MTGKIAMTRTLSGLFLAGLLVDLFLVSGLNFVIYELIRFQVILEIWWFWQQVLSFTLSLGLAALALPFVSDGVFRFEKRMFDSNFGAIYVVLVHVFAMALVLSFFLAVTPPMPFSVYVSSVLFYGVAFTPWITQWGTLWRERYFSAG